jgi:acylphosphatase
MALLLVMCAVAAQGAEPLKVQARLVWGTNDPKSPNTNHVAVDDALAKKLAASPFKWKYYFEVNKVSADIPANTIKPLEMSKHCTVSIKNLGDGRVEIKLEGEGKPVARQVEPLVENWPLILSGDSKNDTAWLVVIEKISDKPKAK